MALSAGVPRAKGSDEPGIGAEAAGSAGARGRVRPARSGRPVVIQCDSAFIAATPSSGTGAVARRSSVPSSQSSWKMRSSDRRHASSAPSHRMPGAMVWSTCVWGPTPKGTSVAKIRKKTSDRPKPPPARTASARSRFQKAQHQPTSSAKGSPPKGSSARRRLAMKGVNVKRMRIGQAEVDMGGDHRGAARGQMRLHRAGRSGRRSPRRARPWVRRGTRRGGA